MAGVDLERGEQDEQDDEGYALAGPSLDPAALGSVRLPRLTRRTLRLADGHEVGVAVCGEGVPLVLVHGFTAEGFLYAQTLWRLVDMGFKVVAVDTAGHGGTQGLPTGGRSLSAYAQLLGRALDELGVHRAVLVGHSMGGRLAAEMAAVQPERVIALLLVDAIVGRTWDRMVNAARLFPPLMLGVSTVLFLDCLTTLPYFRDPRQAAKLARLAVPTMLGHVVRPWRLLGPGVSILRSRSSAWMLDDLRRLRIPTFVIHGERDLAVPIATGRDAAERTGGEMVVVESAAHSWILCDPEVMPAIVLELMKGRLGTAVLRAKLAAGLDLDATPAEVDANAAFYAPGSPVLAMTPRQRWQDDGALHRAPRFAWRVERPSA